MSYKITVLKSEVTKAPKGYSVAEIAYKTADGNTKGMKVLDFVQKDVFAVVKEAKPGDILDAEFEKNPKGFWVFKSLIATGHKEDTSSSLRKTQRDSGYSRVSLQQAIKRIRLLCKPQHLVLLQKGTGKQVKNAQQNK